MERSVRDGIEEDVRNSGKKDPTSGRGRSDTASGGRNGSWVGGNVPSFMKNKYALGATLLGVVILGGGGLAYKFGSNPFASKEQQGGDTVISGQVITPRTSPVRPEPQEPITPRTSEPRDRTPPVRQEPQEPRDKVYQEAVVAPEDTATIPINSGIISLEEQCPELYNVSEAPTQDKILSCVERSVAYLNNVGTCDDAKPHYLDLMGLVDRLQQDNFGSQQTRMYILGSVAQKCEIPREDVVGLNPEQLEQKIFQE